MSREYIPGPGLDVSDHMVKHHGFLPYTAHQLSLDQLALDHEHRHERNPFMAHHHDPLTVSIYDHLAKEHNVAGEMTLGCAGSVLWLQHHHLHAEHIHHTLDHEHPGPSTTEMVKHGPTLGYEHDHNERGESSLLGEHLLSHLKAAHGMDWENGDPMVAAGWAAQVHDQMHSPRFLTAAQMAESARIAQEADVALPFAIPPASELVVSDVKVSPPNVIGTAKFNEEGELCLNIEPLDPKAGMPNGVSVFVTLMPRG